MGEKMSINCSSKFCFQLQYIHRLLMITWPHRDSWWYCCRYLEFLFSNFDIFCRKFKISYSSLITPYGEAKNWKNAEKKHPIISKMSDCSNVGRKPPKNYWAWGGTVIFQKWRRQFISCKFFDFRWQWTGMIQMLHLNQFNMKYKVHGLN